MKRQKALIVVAMICLTVSLLSFSALAAVDPAFSVKVCDSTSPLISDTSPALINVNGYLSCFFTTDPDVPLVMCPWNSGSPNNNVGTASCIAMSTDPDAVLYSIRYRNDGTIYSPAVLRPLSLSFVSGGVTYYYYELAGNSGEYCYPIDSMPTTSAGAISACVSALNYTPSDPVFDHTVSMYIQPGTMVRIKSPGNLTWNLETTFDYTCRKVNGSYQWLYNSSYYFVNPTAVGLGFNTSSFVNDNYNSHLIPWLRMNPLNLWGNSQNAKYATVSALNGSYLYIYIPVSDYHDWDSWFAYGLFTKQSQNHPVLLECDNASEIVVYTMGEAVESGFIHGTTQSFYTYTEYGTFEGQDGSSVSTVTSDIELDPQTSTLDTLVSTIQSFFTGTWSHISSLVSSLGTFPNFVVQLYSWLPLEFRAVLLSAFSIAMVVGVLKVML